MAAAHRRKGGYDEINCRTGRSCSYLHKKQACIVKFSESLKGQLQRNFVAIVSVVIAVSSLSYNTWRNEKSEYNRTQRLASLQLLLKLGELQELVFHSHYDRDMPVKGNPRTGWALVLTIKDLSQVLESPLPDSAAELGAVWGERWDELGDKQSSVEAINEGVELVREDTLELLRALN
jgi:hypothetical protein